MITENSKGSDFVIYFASQTGTAENFAAIIKKEASEHNLSARVIDLANLTKEEFLENKNCVFIMATHYEGDPPDNAAKFWDWFSDEQSCGPDYLSEHKFTCFALGNTDYERTFARIGQ